MSSSAGIRFHSEDQKPISSSPMRAMSLALVGTALALAFLAWNTFTSLQLIEDLERHHQPIEKLRGKIIYLDEVLTMSARMAAATGDLQWEARYRKFEPELREAIQQAMVLVPGTVSVETVARTGAANSALVEIEESAFDLIHRHQLEAARATLFSTEYDRQKKLYAAGMADLDSALQQAGWRDVEGEIQRGKTVLVISAMALSLLFLCWIIVLRAMNRWKTALTRRDMQLSRKTDELTELNANLDRKVAERTSELESSRKKVLHHLEEAQQAQMEIARLDLEGDVGQEVVVYVPDAEVGMVPAVIERRPHGAAGGNELTDSGVEGRAPFPGDRLPPRRYPVRGLGSRVLVIGEEREHGIVDPLEPVHVSLGRCRVVELRLHVEVVLHRQLDGIFQG